MKTGRSATAAGGCMHRKFHHWKYRFAIFLTVLLLLATACGNSAQNRRLSTWKEGVKEEPANDRAEGIYSANKWEDGRNAILFVHGMGDQVSLGGIPERFGQTHNVLGFRYSIYAKFEETANDLRKEIVSISRQCDLTVVGYSFGANILWQSVLDAEPQEEPPLRNVDARLVAPMFGSKYARGYSKSISARMYSALPFTPNVSNLLKAVDPEGETVKSLIGRYDEFVSRVRSAEMFIVRGDSLNPNREVVSVLSITKFYWTPDEITAFNEFLDKYKVNIISASGLQGDAHLNVWKTGEIYESIAAANRPTILGSRGRP